VELDVALFDVALAAGAPADALVAFAADQATRLRSHGALTVLELEVALDAAGVPAADRVAALDAHTPWAAQHARFTGTGADLAALLAALASVVDGVRLHPAVLDVDLPELAHGVLPRLREGTPLATPRPGDTLRQTLGLPVAVNRYQESA